MTNAITYPIAEHQHPINGVSGRMYPINAPQMVRGRLVHRAQKWISEARKIRYGGQQCEIQVEIRFDDECQNGHQTFTITGSIYDGRRRGDSSIVGGCIHSEIARYFPELAPLIKWHLFSTDGPMHYLGNTMYMAGDCDSSGKRKGEPCRFETVVYFGNSPVSHKISEPFTKWLQARMIRDQDGGWYLNPEHGEFRTVAIAHSSTNAAGEYKYSPNYSFAGFRDGVGDRQGWAYVPFNDEATAQQWAIGFNSLRCEFDTIPTAFSEGKARDLDSARRAALWPEATDDQLCLPRAELKALLESRLPALLAEFNAAMESIDFMGEPAQPAA